jgi:hypothetical protein
LGGQIDGAEGMLGGLAMVGVTIAEMVSQSKLEHDARVSMAQKLDHAVTMYGVTASPVTGRERI